MPPHLASAAGTIATMLFVASTVPMLYKAARTRDLASYSGTNLIVATVGNLLQALYLSTLPAGPVWALHAFNTGVTGLMLVWWLWHRRTRIRPVGTDPTERPAEVSGACGAQ